jgi:molecular chaperone DnaJ
MTYDEAYRVLGLQPGASADQIHAAYRDLVKQYHPDQYRDNPLAELAEEKLRQVNEAYQLLTSAGSGNSSSSGSGNAGYGSGANTADSALYQQARQAINRGALYEAEQVLNRANPQAAETFYLRGAVYARRGWYKEARDCFEAACAREPGNPEYRQALDQMYQANRNYQTYARREPGQLDNQQLCQICGSLWCAVSCCECMGGDLCRCM